jgi:hypothetical protein
MANTNDDVSSTKVNATDALVLTNIFYPVVDRMAKSYDECRLEDVRQTMFQLEGCYPGFARTFLQALFEQDYSNVLNQISLNELTLRLDRQCDRTAYLITLHPKKFVNSIVKHKI